MILTNKEKKLLEREINEIWLMILLIALVGIYHITITHKNIYTKDQLQQTCLEWKEEPIRLDNVNLLKMKEATDCYTTTSRNGEKTGYGCIIPNYTKKICKTQVLGEKKNE